jgi:hypothetical protein
LVPGAIVFGDDHKSSRRSEAFKQFFAARIEVPVALPWSQVMVMKSAS